MPTNTTIITGATQLDLYLGNYAWADIVSDMEALRFKLDTGTNRLVHKNAAGTVVKEMADASEDTNHAQGRVLFTDANGAADTVSTLLFTANVLGVGLAALPDWDGSGSVVCVGDPGALSYVASGLSLTENAYYDSSDSRWEYVADGYASRYLQSVGTHTLQTAVTGTANDEITWLNIMTWASDTFKFFFDGTTESLRMDGTYFRINPGMANIGTAIYYDNGVAITVAGSDGDIVLNALAVTGSLGNVSVNWDSGVGLFVQGSDGVVGVGTATVQTWKTATYESVLSFGAAGRVAIAVDTSNAWFVSNEYYDATSDRWEWAGEAQLSSAMLLGAGWFVYMPSATSGGAGDALTHIEVLHAKATGAGAGEFVINDGRVNIDTRIEGGSDTHLIFVDGSTDKACISATAGLAAKLTIEQDDASGESCLSLDQNDESEGCIDFVASDRGPLAWGLSTAASVRVELNGTVYLIPLLANA